MSYPKLTPIIAKGATEPRYLEDRFADVINVRDFGAKGDGETDDTVAINAALTAAATMEDGKVFLPAGTYVISHMIDIPANTCFFGAGMSATIIQASTSMPRWTTILNAGSPSSLKTGIEIRDLTVDGKSVQRLSNSSGAAGTDWPVGIPDAMRGSNVMVCRCENVLVKNVRSIDASLHCIDVTGASYYGIGTASSDGDSVTTNPYPSRYVTVDSCIAEGGGDDNITTHQCSDVVISNCVSKNSRGIIVPTNSNAYEIDDSSRNVTVYNCVGSGCTTGIQIKSHETQCAPWNVKVNQCSVYNCAFGVSVRHSDRSGLANAAEMFEAADYSVADASGNEVNIYGYSPTGRNIIIDNVSIYAPKDYTSYNETVTEAGKCFVTSYITGVYVNNMIIDEGYYVTSSDYSPADELVDVPFGIVNKSEDVYIKNLTIIGFKTIRSSGEVSSPYAIYLGSNTKNISLEGVTIRESRPYGLYANNVDGLTLNDINVKATESEDNICGIYVHKPEAVDSLGTFRVVGYVTPFVTSNQRPELNFISSHIFIGDKNSTSDVYNKSLELSNGYGDVNNNTMLANSAGVAYLRQSQSGEALAEIRLSARGVIAHSAKAASAGVNASSTDTVFVVGKATSTDRSINAGGTVNASGADYAEYMYKANSCGTIQKGQVCGIDADGKLTDKYSLAHSFVVKSTKPSYVGGDTWSDVLGERPEPPSIEGDVQPTAEDFEAYDSALAAYEEHLEAVRQTVDRIAFAGIAPCIVSGEFHVGDYVKAEMTGNDAIVAVAVSSPSFEDMAHVVGKIWKIVDGMAHIVVKPV